MIRKFRKFCKTRRIGGWIIFYLAIYIVFIIKFLTIKSIDFGVIFGVYSVTVSIYILSRFALAYIYKPELPTDNDFEPTITFGVPTKNEEDVIRKTILSIAESDYPKSKFDIIAIDDGSSDDTLHEMRIAQKIVEQRDVHIQVVHWQENKGKREGMAECIRRSSSDIIIFIDSDSLVESNTVRELIRYFIDDSVGMVAGHGYVANGDKNFITKMQEVRYFVAFKAYKAAEALFSSVTCCSGCCSAYRRKPMLDVLEPWLNQHFLGVRCTYGDDRSLTNFLLQKGYRALYAPKAAVHTFVPETFKQFMRQQLRWKKSWIRESLKAGKFMWKKNPIMAFSFYLGLILPMLAPAIVLRALVWYPFATGNTPHYYILGLFLMAVIYGLYYYIYTGDKKWIYGVLFATFYTLVLIWQLPYAILNIRDARWGTR